MTSKGTSSRPILTLGGQDKEQNSPAEKQPTLPLDKNLKTKDEQRDKQKGEQKSEYDFDVIYKVLHAKFPTIINMDKPVLLAVGIRREILKHLEEEKDITNLILNKWIKWYFRKSKYYSMHKVGTVRYNLDGTNAGTVTEKDQAKRDKQIQQIKEYQSGQKSSDKKTGSTKQDKPVDENESKDSDTSHDSSDAK
ncbi:ProQ/FINO family protein [Rickettsiaceae bacterium]|nr:ProQ/FINO family protein [Rickettsiaceae bacterium]